MKYNRFEDVPVWQAGIELTTRIFTITEDRSFRYKGDIANQIQRAALSVPNNIAEGFERGTTQELITFLYYSKGSAGEVRSICHVIDRLAAFNHLKSEISDLKSLAESISRQLSAWARSLQETDIEGPRRLTDAKKASYEQKKRADAFMSNLRDKYGKQIEANIKRQTGTNPEQ
jgi:four helix bundle protein